MFTCKKCIENLIKENRLNEEWLDSFNRFGFLKCYGFCEFCGKYGEELDIHHSHYTTD